MKTVPADRSNNGEALFAILVPGLRNGTEKTSAR